MYKCTKKIIQIIPHFYLQSLIKFISMEIFKANQFYAKFLPKYFSLAYHEFSRNISSVTWVDVAKPFNIYRFMWEFFKFIKSILRKDQYNVLTQLLQKQFIIPIDKLLDHHSEKSHLNTIYHEINNNMSQMHICSLQVLLRISIIDMRFSINDIQEAEKDILLKDIHKLISHIRITSVNNDQEFSAKQIIQYLMTRLIEKSESKQTLIFIKTLLKKCEIFARYKNILAKQLQKYLPKPKSQFIQKFEEISIPTIQKRTLVEKKQQNMMAIEPPLKTELSVVKTPEKKIIYNSRNDDSIEKSIRVIPNHKFAQRTIFEVKNKKFIPKKIQYISQTAASSCSNTTSNLQFNMMKRNSYNPKMFKDDMILTNDKGTLVDATPIKKDKTSIFQTQNKKSLDKFTFDGLFNKNMKMMK